MDLIREKLSQAKSLVASSHFDVWCIFVRETGEGGDPVLGLLHHGGLTWQSALLIFKSGKTVALVGNYDADPLKAAGLWDEVVPYVQGIRDPLLETLKREVPRGGKVGVNFSTNDVKADGLSHGMYLLLQDYFEGSPFELVSAEKVCAALRSRKSPTEIGRMKGAIAETDLIFSQVPKWCATMPSEMDVYHRIQDWIDHRNLGYSWEKAANPIVNSGPNSMIGHGTPSKAITVSPGYIFHIDLGVLWEGYASDIQRCWYVPDRGESDPPADVMKAFRTVVDAITIGADHLKPGIAGWQVDEAARRHIVQCGYPEYMHALGHQVGRMAHDGGSTLGPKWERYGEMPFFPIEVDQVFTLELGVMVEGRGYLGLEEMVVVRESGVEWLTQRQLEMPLL